MGDQNASFASEALFQNVLENSFADMSIESGEGVLRKVRKDTAASKEPYIEDLNLCIGVNSAANTKALFLASGERNSLQTVSIE